VKILYSLEIGYKVEIFREINRRHVIIIILRCTRQLQTAVVYDNNSNNNNNNNNIWCCVAALRYIILILILIRDEMKRKRYRHSRRGWLQHNISIIMISNEGGSRVSAAGTTRYRIKWRHYCNIICARRLSLRGEVRGSL